MPGHSAGVRYSLGINVITPFFSSAHASIWVGASVLVQDLLHCTWALKLAPGPCVLIVFVSFGAVHCIILTAKLMFLNGV